MAITAYKSWSSGEILTAADLNSSFSQIINNPIDLWSPATKAMDLGGFALTNGGSAAFTTLSTSGLATLASATVTAALTVNGNVTLGDALADTITIGGGSSKNATGNWVFAAPSSGTTLTVTGVSGQASIQAGGSFAGAVTYIYSLNSDNTNAASHSAVVIGSGGASGGDPYVSYQVTGVNSWYAGIDNSDSDSFKIGVGATVGSADAITVTTGRNITIAAPSSGVGFTGTGFAGSDAFVYNGGTSGSFRVNTTGVPYGTSLHNNAGAVTGTTNQYITSGTYTPTFTSIANLDSTPTGDGVWKWTRVGNVVHVVGRLAYDATTASVQTEYRVSLPIASAFANITDAIGVVGGANSAAGDSTLATVQAHTANDQLHVLFVPASAASKAQHIMATYEIL